MKKKPSLNLLCCLLIFAGINITYGQDNKKPETIFVTEYSAQDKASPQIFFTQISLSIPFRSNPAKDEVENYDDTEPTVLDYFLPDGIGLNYGIGIHFKSWIGLSANTGIEWIGSEKLVSAPVYGSVIFIPRFFEDTNLYMQAGYGYAFALGRGNLSGTYAKARLGLAGEMQALYVEVTGNNFNMHGKSTIGSFSIGVTLYDFGL
ncbi:hypothetical protein [Flavobacterium rhizosphaerae]|uniref:Outer membrane protein beta-barrel domain-containing protein n=1 Tax=Flavobacterium rhizosphaerae TaxID=3163298 RepID=A0ABW8YZJ7_9FLAO